MHEFKDTRLLKRKIVVALIAIFLVAIVAIEYREFHYASALEITGTFVDIQSKTNNHQLPKYMILDNANKKVEISQFTVALNPSIIKIGGKIVKKKGDNFCIINGKKILFAFY